MVLADLKFCPLYIAQDDTKETTFEVSVAGEVLKEMLEVRYGRALMAGALLVEAQEREVGAERALQRVCMWELVLFAENVTLQADDGSSSVVVSYRCLCTTLQSHGTGQLRGCSSTISGRR